MADETPTFINNSKGKRQRTEDFEEASISHLIISSQDRCKNYFADTLTNIEINPNTASTGKYYIY